MYNLSSTSNARTCPSCFHDSSVLLKHFVQLILLFSRIILGNNSVNEINNKHQKNRVTIMKFKNVPPSNSLVRHKKDSSVILEFSGNVDTK